MTGAPTLFQEQEPGLDPHGPGRDGLQSLPMPPISDSPGTEYLAVACDVRQQISDQTECWPMMRALAWIMSRDEDVNEFAPFRRYSKRLPNEAVAREILIAALQRGDLVARRTHHELTPEFWRGRNGNELPADVWVNRDNVIRLWRICPRPAAKQDLIDLVRFSLETLITLGRPATRAEMLKWARDRWILRDSIRPMIALVPQSLKFRRGETRNRLRIPDGDLTEIK